MSPNVLHLIGSFHEGGSERQAVQLARLIQERGRYRVQIACLDASGPLRAEIERLGFGETREFPLTSFYDFNAAKQLLRFARFLRRHEIAVVHTHDFYTNVFGMAGAALARVPARIASRRETTGWRTAAQKFVERRAYQLAHTIIANAEAVRDQLLDEGVAQHKVVTIHNGVNLDRTGSGDRLGRDDALAMFDLPRVDDEQLITIVANLRHRVKNHAMFLRAARRVVETVPKARFVIAGEGELMPSLRAMAEELGIGNSVSFIGRCERIAELLALSDVCALSSTAEGFSNSILEYMAAGRPVVATDVGGAREAILDGETGYLVPSDDHERMANRIVALLQNPERARAMGKRGSQIIEEKFLCDLQVEKTQQLYDLVLERTNSTIRNNEDRRVQGSAGDLAVIADTRPTGTPDLPRMRAEKAAKPVRVLIVAPSLDILGGQAVQAARLVARLKEEPTLAVSFLPINPRLPGRLRKLQEIRYLRTVVTSLLYWCLLLARVRNHDVIHVFSASYLSFILAPTPAILVSKLFGKRIVLNYRSGEAADHLQRWRRTAIPTIRLVDRIVVPSGYLVDVFARFGLTARPIFNFVETDRFRYRERSPLRPVFLSNRNLEPHYNVGCALRAFAIIQQRFPDARLVVAGDGSQRAGLESLALELNLQNVEFVGLVAQDKMHELASAADIYLNCPEIDNMPGSIIEAFALGLPVLTTDAGGIPYIVSDEITGLMVKTGDYNGIADRAIRLLENNRLAERISNNAREECRKYSWKSVRNEWLKLYHELVRAEADEFTALNEAPVREHS